MQSVELDNATARKQLHLNRRDRRPDCPQNVEISIIFGVVYFLRRGGVSPPVKHQIYDYIRR